MNYPMMMPIPYPMPSRSGGGYKRSYNNSYRLRKLYKKNKKMGTRLKNLNKFKKHILSLNPPGEEPTTIGADGNVKVNPRRILFGYNDGQYDYPEQEYMRKAMKYKGLGDYRETLGRYIPPGSFARAGEWLGSASGVPGLGSVGGWLGNKASRYLGFGDYGPVSTNQIVHGGGGAQQQISVNQNDLSGDIVLTHTSFVSNVTASTGAGVTSSPFQITGYDLNPGVAETFPWLAQIAVNYELYDWCGLMFQFKPTSGEFGSSTSNALGKVIMATRYGVNQTTQFSSSIEMQNYDYANSSKPSCGMIHGIETENHKQVGGDMLLVRNGPPTDSRVLYDVGRFYVATEGVPMAASTTAIVGELWVTYSLKLSRAKLAGILGQDIEWGRVRDIASAAALSTGPVQAAKGTIPIAVTNVSATQVLVTIPANSATSQYLWVHWDFNNSAVGTVTGTLTNVVNATEQNVQLQANTAPTTGATANSKFILDLFYLVTNPGLPFTFNLNTTGALGANSGWTLFVSVYNQNII